MKQYPLIMVVEDETVLLQTIAMKLDQVGVETLSCTSSDQCVDYLENIEELPDAIWLDYYLKGSQNALKLLTTIKGRSEWKDIPAVIVSNSASQEKINSMMALGANHYILKADYKLSEIVDFFLAFINDNEAGKRRDPVN